MVTPLCLQPFCFTAIIPVRASCWYGERCGEGGASSRVLANEKFSYAMPVCCVPYCRQSYKNGAKLYRFPANPERKAAWVSRIKRPLWEPTSTSRVCGVHFELSCFEEKRADGWRRLKLTAIPTLFSSQASPKYKPAEQSPEKVVPHRFEEAACISASLGATACDPPIHASSEEAVAASSSTPEPTEEKQCSSAASTSSHELSTSATSTTNNTACVNASPGTAAGDPPIHALAESTIHDEICSDATTGRSGPTLQSVLSTAASLTPQQDDFISNDSMDIVTEGPTNIMSLPENEPPPKRVTEGTENVCCLELKKALRDVLKKYSSLQEHHVNARKQIRTLKSQLKCVQQQLQALKEPKFLADDQKKVLAKQNSRGMTWSMATIKQALQVKFACGTTGYELLRTLRYPLPSTRTLMRRLQGFCFLPGILKEVLDVLKKKVETMEDAERDRVLFLDEMEISGGIEHDQSQDCFLGSVTLPKMEEVEANRALVFMLGGLTTRWKQVVAYHFTGRSLEGTLLKDFVLEIVKLSFEAGLKVLVVTSDMGAPNRAMWRELGLSSTRDSDTVCSISHPCLEGRRLYFMADVAHLLKNIRAQLIRSDIFFLSKRIVEENGLPTNIIKLEYIDATLKLDKENELKVAPHMSDIHLSDGHFTKMKVNIAVQFFREAPVAIRYRVSQGQLPAQAETTAWFCELVSEWFTLMSARHPVVALSNFDATKHQAAIEKLNITACTFREMTMGSTSHWKPSQAGLITSTTVVYQLQHELLNEHGYGYLLTGRMTQDCLENLFSVVRLRKPVPEACEFKCALRMICVSQFVQTPRTSGYAVDDGEQLADLFSEGARVPSEEPEAPEEIMDWVLSMLSKEEKDILAYVGGFLLRAVLKSVNCNTCKEALTSNSNSKHSTLIKMKEFVKHSENLIYPSDKAMEFLIECEEQFKGLTFTTDILSLCSPFKSIASVLTRNSSVNTGVCSQHRDSVEKLLLEKYLHFRLKIHLKQARLEKRASGHSSKTCAGVNLS